ncbi:hypothetical protein EMCRGX_G014441 [Ephydatia muelleri]
MREVRQEYERIIADVGDDTCYDLWPRADILCKPTFIQHKDADEVSTSFQESEECLTEVDASEYLRERLASVEAKNEVQRESKETEVQTEPQQPPHFLGKAHREGTFETKEAEIQTELQPLLVLDSKPRKVPESQPTPEPPIVMETYLGTAQQQDMELPKDKETLLELRAKVAMELMWVNQAIASRKKYLQLKESLDVNS